MRTDIGRRQFLASSTMVVSGFAALRHASSAGQLSNLKTNKSYGLLKPDPAGILDLPEGFQYTIISRWGEKMDDGLLVPALHDGMAAFPDPQGRTILVRNHEVGIDSPLNYGAFGSNLELLDQVDPRALFDSGQGEKPCLGGTTTIVYDTKRRQVLRHFLSLAGTGRNCSGGPTPWGTWLTCEEWTQQKDEFCAHDHGWVFEVPASSRQALHKAKPLKALGRFYHEAVAVGPLGNCLYLTEDLNDGVFYRFVPNVPTKLDQGGRLQAMVLRDGLADTRNWINPATESSPFTPGTKRAVDWIDLEETDSPEDDLRLRAAADGAALFARGEGLWAGNDSVYLACTNGGVGRSGQIWRYHPSPQEGTSGESKTPAQLELFIESDKDNIINNCDNLTIAPWGDLFVCEDSLLGDGMVRVSPTGEVERFAMHRGTFSELAGVCASPDGSTLFVNIQGPGMTMAITGPWQS